MTGTAETEAAEFFDIYKLGVLTIPTNKPNIRKDAHDSVYKTRREKFIAVVKEIKDLHAQGRPILVGTISVETSEMLSRMLKRKGSFIPFSTQSFTSRRRKSSRARASAARSPSPRTWPVAARTSNSAGRDGSRRLARLGTERHESRRIDRQLRGRCSRQGDPGSSHFFISLEDDLMRLFGSDRIVKLMEKMGLEEGQELSIRC
jgi:preprotein translocase subunit SecA